jgi:hypothetical protein
LKRQRKEIVAKEQDGAAGAFERCRALAEQIRAEVREKEPEGLDTNALAEFLVALQRAASVVVDGAATSTVTAAPSANPPGPPDEPPAPAGS